MNINLRKGDGDMIVNLLIVCDGCHTLIDGLNDEYIEDEGMHYCVKCRTTEGDKDESI